MAMRQIAIVPILISKWGVAYYGSWLILSALPTFLSMSNLGLGTSAANKIALRAGKEEDQNRETVSTAWLMIVAIGLLVTVSVYLYQAFLVDKTKTNLANHTWIVICLLGSLFVRMLAQPVHGWWIAAGKASKSLNANNIYYVGELLLYLLIPLAGGMALMLTSIMLCWSVCWLSFYLFQTRKSGCKILNLSHFSKPEAGDLLKVGLGHQLNPLWQGILYQGSIMVAGKILGPAGAALWGSLRIINRSGNQSLELVSQTAGPEFQRNFANSDRIANQKLHAKSLLVSLFLGSVVCCGLLFFGAIFFKKWTHGEFNEPQMIWVIMPLSLLPFSIWWVSGEFQRSLNYPWYFNIVGVASSCVAVCAMYVLAPMGIVGMAYGSLLFECLMAALILPRSIKISGENLVSFLLRCRQELYELSKLVAKFLASRFQNRRSPLP